MNYNTLNCRLSDLGQVTFLKSFLSEKDNTGIMKICTNKNGIIVFTSEDYHNNKSINTHKTHCFLTHYKVSINTGYYYYAIIKIVNMHI